MIKQCLICKKEFKTKPCLIRIGKGKYCSPKCSGINSRGGTSWNKGIPCPEETKIKISIKNKGKICWNKGKKLNYSVWNKGTKGICKAWNKGIPHSTETRNKISKARMGHIAWNKGTKGIMKAWNKGKKLPQLSREKHFNWKGGKIKKGKYYYILKPEHPLCTAGGYIAEHRFIVENYLRRFLDPKEVIHHINENPTDNRIENLILCVNNAEHKKFHCKILSLDCQLRITNSIVNIYKNEIIPSIDT